mmetsp:Transcript_63928/g.175513  ORF Transcript_63928/g.175513 Transcript_63928/m.175513 type:complete len:207 (+) Transcript_63928:398-1018(+)
MQNSESIRIVRACGEVVQSYQSSSSSSKKYIGSSKAVFTKSAMANSFGATACVTASEAASSMLPMADSSLAICSSSGMYLASRRCGLSTCSSRSSSSRLMLPSLLVSKAVKSASSCAGLISGAATICIISRHTSASSCRYTSAPSSGPPPPLLPPLLPPLPPPLLPLQLPLPTPSPLPPKFGACLSSTRYARRAASLATALASCAR